MKETTTIRVIGGAAFLLAAVLALGLAATSATPVAAAGDGSDLDAPACIGERLRARSPLARPFGKSYGQWGNEWWKWRLAIDADDDPVADESGAKCALNQSGPVWFLAGAQYGMGPVTRECTVPEGKSLLFPVVNSAWLSWLIDVPWDGGCAIPNPDYDPDDPDSGPECWYYRPTEDANRDTIGETLDGTADRFARIDGRRVWLLDLYRSWAPLFEAWLPADNLIDRGTPEGFELWGEGDSGPHVQDGWYVMTTPLDDDDEVHTVRFGGTFYPDTDWEWTVDVTYEITVGESE